MQSTRLLIVAHRCSSASKLKHLLQRSVLISSRANLHCSAPTLSLVNRCTPSRSADRFLSLPEAGLGTVQSWQFIRYASSISLPSHKRITLPALSPTMETGTLRSWAKKEGDKVAEGDVLAELETDKATLGFESSEEGYLAKILLPGGSKDVPVGKLCAIIVEKEEDIAAFKDYTDSGDESSTPQKASDEQKSSPVKHDAPSKTDPSTASAPKKEEPREKKAASASGSSKEGRVIASPLARKLAEEKGIQLDSIQGTGPEGRILADDVEKFMKEGGIRTAKEERSTASKPATKDREPSAARAGGYDEQQLSALRAENARLAVESKSTIPHYYLTIEVELTELLSLRQKLNDMLTPKSKDAKVKAQGITMNDFIVKAAALACKKRPETNSIWMDKSIRQYETVDINVAIATDAGVNMAPIIYNVEQKGLGAINKELSQLSDKAHGGDLGDNELEMGTFTISNLGMYGVQNFSAVIHPQQSAFLAIGGVETRIVPDAAKGFRSSSVLNVTLACDHRVIDGAVGAQWLQEFKQYLENPGSMIL